MGNKRIRLCAAVLAGILCAGALYGCGRTEPPLQEVVKEEYGVQNVDGQNVVEQKVAAQNVDGQNVVGQETKEQELVVAGAAAAEPVRTEDATEELNEIAEYQARFEEIGYVGDIEAKGYRLMEEQIFPIVMESFGQEECTFYVAMEKQYYRLAVFLADSEGRILFKTNQLATNNRIPGQLAQPVRSVAAVNFSDLNRDGLTDVVLITGCVNGSGEYAGKTYKVGDVLFQGEQTFYRDWRISDKINRFDMNKSVNCIISYVRDGQSTEFLYTSKTLDELLAKGFHIIEEQHYTRRFEKLGKIQVVPGTYHMSEYDIFMIYLVNEQGNIVWCFQPMGSFDNLYSLRGVVGKDVDGDGMKDLIVLARYSYEGAEGELETEMACSIYYQRTGGFEIDTGFTESYQCTQEDTMEALITKIRAYWGWQVEEEEESD